MKLLRAVAMPCGLLLVIFSLALATSFAADGSALYRERCAPCHGNNGEGRTAIKAPSLVSVKVKEMSDDDLRAKIAQRANGEMEKDPSHTRLKKRLSPDQAREIVAYIREMQSRLPAR